MSDTLIGLIGVAIGGSIGILGNWLHWSAVEEREIRALRASFLGEITAIISLVEYRDYIRLFNSIADEIKVTRVAIPFDVQVTQSYFQVYEKNLDKIGKLGSEAGDICNFYTNCFGVLEDFETLRRFKDKESTMGPGEFVDRYVYQYKRLATFLTDSMTQGKQLQKRLQENCNMCTPTVCQ
jgi:hypothetical protein